MDAATLAHIITELTILMQKAPIRSTDKTQTYPLSNLIFSVVVLLCSVSGKKSFDTQRAAGADIIEAVKICAA